MITTTRLNLIAMTPALALAELHGPAELAAALGAGLPEFWPPELYDRDDLERMRRLLEEPANAGWALYYLVQAAAPHALVGVAGYAGRPTPGGMVEIGYSVLPAFRRRGLASEAVGALVARAFLEPVVTTVRAETLPGLDGSMGVLRRNGFTLVRGVRRGGTLRYEVQRAGHTASTT